VASEGDGVATLPDGSRVYVPLSVPGDVAMVRPVARRGEGWAGEIETLLQPGGSRRAPVCSHFGACGGCVAQHRDDDAYLAWKVSRLATELRRAGFDAPPIAPIAPGVPATRRRMDLAARRLTGHVTLGLHRARGGEVIDLAECPVLHPDLVSLIAPARLLLSSLAALRREASLIVNLLDSGPDMLLRTDGELAATDRAKLLNFAHSRHLARVSWARGTDAQEPVCVLRPPVTSLSGVAIAPPPGAFLQATAAGEAAIIAAVLDALPAKRPARARAADLYAGCGTISFALARSINVTAFEGDAAQTSACRDAANRAGLMGRIEVRQRDLSRQPLSAAELSGFAAVILDPPHGGAAAQIPAIAQSRVSRVIYVSCDPVSLGRDARVLREAGYHLAKVMPIDQFPWSARLEAVAAFHMSR
jgi:23S rRNA (uracil1939-C5)-methyltransferase